MSTDVYPGGSAPPIAGPGSASAASSVVALPPATHASVVLVT